MIDFNQVGFTYDGQTFSLDDITLTIPQGSFACILGGNGSGKSTLAKHINALLIPDRGAVHVLDKDTSDSTNLYFIRSNAGMVFQNPDDQIVASLVENDVAFGPENLGVPTEQLRERVSKALEQVGLQGFEQRETSQLSGGQKQRVAIAGVLAMEPQILVLDEASAMLDPRGRAGLLRVCQQLNEAGMTIVMITHFMEEAALADIVFVLRDGRIAAEGKPAQVLSDVEALESQSLDVPFAAKVSHILQQQGIDIPTCISEDELVAAISDRFARKPASTSASEPAPMTLDDESLPFETEEQIVFEHVSYTYDPEPRKRRASAAKQAADWGNSPDQAWALTDINFALHSGEFLGIAGHTGSGKSTLLQHMNGLLHPTQGRVLVQGRDIADKAEAAHARESVGLVFQYPEHQLFAANVYADVAFGPRNMGLDEDEVHNRVEQALEMVGLDYQQIAQVSPFELSGGQQRRVAFAGVLAMGPTTLILDEPAAGLDPKARTEFMQLIEDFHIKQGMTIVMASHNMDDLARLSNRILVLNQGAQFAYAGPSVVFADQEACHKVGLDVPSAQRIATRLKENGLPITDGVFYTASAVAQIIAPLLRSV